MSLTCSSQLDLSSSVAFLNSRIPLPRDFPSSGSFFGPKTKRATTKIISISEKPRLPIYPPGTGVYDNKVQNRQGHFLPRPEAFSDVLLLRAICYNASDCFNERETTQ